MNENDIYFYSGVLATVLIGLLVRKILKDRKARKARAAQNQGRTRPGGGADENIEIK